MKKIMIFVSMILMTICFTGCGSKEASVAKLSEGTCENVLVEEILVEEVLVEETLIEEIKVEQA